jgi:L-2-amino-thiazoline-4-carboxylic acid hydrolase
MDNPTSLPPATGDLNAMGVLTRREIEARILAPMLAAFCSEFERERVLGIARQVIVRVAREQGAQLAEQYGGCSLAHFSRSLEAWKKGGALVIDVLEENDTEFSFDVTRCRYAEMYHTLGIAELGEILSCNRDYALIEGFNPNVELRRTQTIMRGAPYCDFRYHVKKAD